jgi:hypothetical protein
MDELETRLARLPLRPAPAAWRLQILAAAQAARPAERGARWWQRWLSPQRLALAAAWLLILFLHLSAPVATRRATPASTVDWRHGWDVRQELLARLLAPPVAAPQEPPRSPQGAAFWRRPEQFI